MSYLTCIPEPPLEEDERFMHMALACARTAVNFGEVPIGAVVVHRPYDPATLRPVCEPGIVSQAWNMRETSCDPAGHAEFIALREAARQMGTWRLTCCTLYVTLEPCLMCAGLMHQARIGRCVYGTADPKAGALGSLYQVNEDTRLNHTFPVRSGILAEECAELLRSFFASRRKR